MHTSTSTAWQRKFCVIFIVIQLFTVTTVVSVNPGLKIRISQPGLKYAANLAVQILSKKVNGYAIPNQDGSASLAVGNVEYNFNGMSVTNFVQPGSSVVVNPGSGLTWTLSNIGVSVHGNWGYRYKVWFVKISDSGSFDVDTSGITLSLSVAIGVNSAGLPTITSIGCSCHVDSVSAHLHGGASWLYSLFIGKIDKALRSALERIVCEAAPKVINENAASQLATLKLQYAIDSAWLLDYSLVANPVFDSGYVETGFKGEFFHAGNHQETPFQPAPIAAVSTSQMIVVSVSDYVVNSAGYALFNEGILKYTLTKNDLSALSLTCNGAAQCAGSILPAAQQLYPTASVEIAIVVSSPPTLTIGTDAMVGNFAGTMVTTARLPDGTLAHLLSLALTVKVSVSVRLTNNLFYITANSLTPTISVTSSSIGIAINHDEFVAMVSPVLIQMLNQAGAKGFAIPSLDGVQLNNVQLQQQANSVSVIADVQYTMTTQSNPVARPGGHRKIWDDLDKPSKGHNYP